MPSRSACSNVTTRSTQRISRPTTSSSATTVSESESSFDTQCGSIATVLSSSEQVGGFSGQRLNIKYFSESSDFESGVLGKDICASFPYSIGPSQPNHLREPWAALIDSGGVTSIAPSSFAPHVPITPHSGQLVNVNGGEIKIKVRTWLRMSPIRWSCTSPFSLSKMFSIQSLAWMHFIKMQFSFMCFKVVRHTFSRRSHKAVLHYYKNHCYPSGLVIPGYVKRSILKWDDPEYTIFDPQSTSQAIAEIDFELNSEARLTQSKEQEEDVSQEAHRPHCLKVPESVTSAEKRSSFPHSPTFQVVVYGLSESKRSAALSQRKAQAAGS